MMDQLADEHMRSRNISRNLLRDELHELKFTPTATHLVAQRLNHALWMTCKHLTKRSNW